MSYASASHLIKSILGRILWMFKCTIQRCLESISNEVIELVELEVVSSVTESGPGFTWMSPHSSKRFSNYIVRTITVRTLKHLNLNIIFLFKDDLMRLQGRDMFL